MGTRYHYNRSGKYTGYSNNRNPYGWVVGLIVIIFVFGILKGC